MSLPTPKVISLTSPPSSSSSRKFKHLALAEVRLSTHHMHTHTTLDFAHMPCACSIPPFLTFLPRYLLQNASSLCHQFRLASPQPVHMDLPLQLRHENILHWQRHLHLISHKSPFPVCPPHSKLEGLIALNPSDSVDFIDAAHVAFHGSSGRCWDPRCASDDRARSQNFQVEWGDGSVRNFELELTSPQANYIYLYVFLILIIRDKINNMPFDY
jgi:hypothetical protein